MKNIRQDMIHKLISMNNVETQEELARLLGNCGFNVTQATVSRDIKEMGLVKSLSPDGHYKYVTVEHSEMDMQDRFSKLFSNCVTSITPCGNLIVIKTITGGANAAAVAVDSLNWPEIIGCIAGDNTIFLAVEKVEYTSELIRRFQKML